MSLKPCQSVDLNATELPFRYAAGTALDQIPINETSTVVISGPGTVPVVQAEAKQLPKGSAPTSQALALGAPLPVFVKSIKNDAVCWQLPVLLISYLEQVSIRKTAVSSHLCVGFLLTAGVLGIRAKS
jgi:hypothetical protein